MVRINFIVINKIFIAVYIINKFSSWGERGKISLTTVFVLVPLNCVFPCISNIKILYKPF